MKSGILGLLLLFTAISGYAQLKCDAPDFAANPAMKDACTNLQKALEEKVTQKLEIFTEAINKARARVSESKLQQAAASAQGASAAGNSVIPNQPQQPSGIAPPNTPATQPTLPVAPVQTTPIAPAVVEPLAPPVQPQQEAAPAKTQRSNSPTKNVIYY